MKQPVSTQARPQDSDGLGLSLRGSSASSREPVILSSLPTGFFVHSPKENHHPDCPTDLAVAGSRPALPSAPDATNTTPHNQTCKGLLKPNTEISFDVDLGASGGGCEEEDGWRSGSCSRWISRSSSFTLATGGMTPLTWRMSANGGDSMFHFSNSSSEPPHPLCFGESRMEEAFTRQNATRTIMEESFTVKDLNSTVGLHSDSLFCNGSCGDDDDEDRSPPMRERSMMPGEVVVDSKANRHLRLRLEQTK